MGKALEKTRCVIIGGCLEEIDPTLANQLLDTDFVLCADRGYTYATEHGILPDLILGDFDSSAKPAKTDAEVLILPTHKDDTDLQFAAREGLWRGFRDFLLTGVTGGRLDHTVAALFTLRFLQTQGATAQIRDRNTCIWLTDSCLSIKRPDYPCYFSVFPFGGAATVSIIGGVYPLNDAVLKQDFPIGVSNEFADDTATVSVKQGNCLVMVVKKE